MMKRDRKTVHNNTNLNHVCNIYRTYAKVTSLRHYVCAACPERTNDSDVITKILRKAYGIAALTAERVRFGLMLPYTSFRSQ